MLMLLPLLPLSAIIIGLFVLSSSDKQALPALSLITDNSWISNVTAESQNMGLTELINRIE